jgi:hypothetical protein
MSNPGTKFFQSIVIKVDVWVDPERTDATLDTVTDNVAISIRNAIDSVAKEIELPDHGIEVCVR